MPRPWVEVQSSPAFQALPPEDQEQARLQYFDAVVAPRVSGSDRDLARQQFDKQFRIATRSLPADVAPSAAGGGRGAMGGATVEDLQANDAAKQQRIQSLAAAVPQEAAQPNAVSPEFGGGSSDLVQQAPAPRMPSDQEIQDAPDAFTRANLLQQRADATPRTLLGTAGDVGQAGLRGAMRVAQIPSAVYGLATGNVDNAVNRFFNEGVEASRAGTSDRSKADAAALQAKIAAAEGWREKLAVGLFETIQDPGMLLETAVEQVPQMLGGAGIGSAVSQGSRRAAGALAVRALSGDSAGLAQAAVAASRVGAAAPTAGAVGGAAVTQGQEAAAETFKEAMRMVVSGDEEFGVPPHPEYVALREQGMSAAQAHREVAQRMAQKAGLISSAVSVGTQMMPGGRSIETAFVRQPTQQAARGGVMQAVGDRTVAGVKETLAEGVEEASSPVARDIALERQINVGDAAAAAGQGMAAGGPMGVVVGRSGLRPTEQRKAINDRLDDFIATHGASETTAKAIDAVKKAAATRPLAETPGLYKRFIAALSKRGQFAEVTEADLAALDEPPQQSAAASGAPVAASGAPAETLSTLDDMAGEGSALAPERTEVDDAANAAATSVENDLSEPTEAQKKAGNYKVGRTRIAGMDISIENPEGSIRRGADADGNPWETTMRAHYGYVLGSQAKDGDNVDVFIKPGTPSAYGGMVYVVDQIDPKTGKYDEAKAVIGAESQQDAEAIYRSNYAADWQGMGAITGMPINAFRAWAASPQARKPLGALNAPDASHGRDAAPGPDNAGRSDRSAMPRGDVLGADAGAIDTQTAGGAPVADSRPEPSADALEPIQPGDLTKPNGQPYRTMSNALSALGRAGEDTHELARVQGGLVIRPKAQSKNAEKPPANPVAETVATYTAQALETGDGAVARTQGAGGRTSKPEVVWTGKGKAGMARQALPEHRNDLRKKYPDLEWTEVEAPEFGPGRWKLEGRKKAVPAAPPTKAANTQGTANENDSAPPRGGPSINAINATNGPAAPNRRATSGPADARETADRTEDATAAGDDAAQGAQGADELLSRYRAKGIRSFILVEARTDAEAQRLAERAESGARELERWDGKEFRPIKQNAAAQTTSAEGLAAPSAPAASVGAETAAAAPDTYVEPKDRIEDEWSGHLRKDFLPSKRQQSVMDSVAKALDSGIFYNREIDDFVAKDLGVTPQQRAKQKEGVSVDGGSFGYDVYHARQAVEAQRDAKANDAAASKFSAGQKIGKAQFEAGKTATSVVVTAVNDGSIDVAFMYGTKRFTATVSAIALSSAIDRSGQTSSVQKSRSRDVDTSKIISLRKRESTLDSLVKCLGGA